MTDFIAKDLADLYLKYKSITDNLNKITNNKLSYYNDSLLSNINNESIKDVHDYVNFCNYIKKLLCIYSGQLQIIEELIEQAWDNACEGKLYIDSGSVLTSKEKFGLYLVPLDEFRQNNNDILMGFYASGSTPSFKTKINVEAGNLVLAEETITRGMKVMLDQPIPLIALQHTCLKINIENNKGMYAICGVFSDNIYRIRLVQESYNWGSYFYRAGYVWEAIPNKNIINISPKKYTFGGEILNII